VLTENQLAPAEMAMPKKELNNAHLGGGLTSQRAGRKAGCRMLVSKTPKEEDGRT